jgi:hypothetical protein
MRTPLLTLAGALMLSAASPESQFRGLAGRYFDEVYFRFNPSAGTSAGFHRYDPLLEDYSREGVQRQVAALEGFRGELERFDRASLPAAVAGDYDMVLANIRGTLLTLNVIRPWERNPDSYSSGVAASVFGIMSRTYAPAPERLQSLVARERQIPAVFDCARRNLQNPPRIYTEIALEQLPGMVSFFEHDVPAAFPGVLTDDFRRANADVVAALRSYERFLRDELLPRSHGGFRIGADTFRKKLLYDEMVDTPLDRLLATGYQDLRRNQAEFARVAASLDAKRTPQQVLHEVERDHPEPDKLLPEFRNVLGGIRDFIRERRIVTIPSPALPLVQETPPFMRALTFASMDTPGPYEQAAREAFLNVTLPEKGWPQARIEEHMTAFSRGTIFSTAIHEAYPGHYVQFLWVQRIPGKVRKLLGAGTSIEGWAHYCEQMMYDEGFHSGDAKLRLGQLQDALLRDARYIVGIEMHTGKMSFDEGVEFFVKEGYQSRANAVRETKRGTSDPTYLMYTLGKLEILRLREDYRKMKGPSFTLLDFHDSFMQQGPAPIRIVRQALLGGKAARP